MRRVKLLPVQCARTKRQRSVHFRKYVSFAATHFLFINSQPFIIHDGKRYPTESLIPGRASVISRGTIEPSWEQLYLFSSTLVLLAFISYCHQWRLSARTWIATFSHMSISTAERSLIVASRHVILSRSIPRRPLRAVGLLPFSPRRAASCSAKSARKYTFN